MIYYLIMVHNGRPVDARYIGQNSGDRRTRNQIESLRTLNSYPGLFSDISGDRTRLHRSLTSIRVIPNMLPLTCSSANRNSFLNLFGILT